MRDAIEDGPGRAGPGPAGRGRIDPIDRAHLTGASRPTPPIHRYSPSPELADLVQRYWIPVWSLPSAQQQSTLQHPACLIVVSDSYARFYGVVRGLSTVTLEGSGWAVGTMLTPAAGALVFGGSVSPLTDRHLDLTDLASLDAGILVGTIQAAMSPDPQSSAAHQAALTAVEDQVRRFLPVDEEGLLVNAVVDWIREHPDVVRVAEVAAAFDLTERTLQRLITHRVGLTPKWLIQRRRLHDAVARIKAGTASLADLAADLGYADQAHFTQDFRTVTGLTPGRYRSDQPGHQHPRP